jgi:hypothetical protein
MEIDRRAFFAGLGGVAVVAAMADEAKAEALEHHMMLQLSVANQAAAGAEKFPTAAEVEAQIETRPSRRGTGNLFVARAGNVKKLPPLPERPTLVDFYKLRFMATSTHCL